MRMPEDGLQPSSGAATAYYMSEKEVAVTIHDQDPWYLSFRELIAVEVSALREQTQSQVNHFWHQHHKVRAMRPYDEWGRLGLRLRERSVVFGIEWYVNSYYGPRKKRVVVSKAVTLAVDRSAKLAEVTSKLKGWELELTQSLEPQFTIVRRQLDEFVKMNLRAQIYVQRKQKFQRTNE